MGTTAIPTSTLPSRMLETPMVVSPEDTPMLMLRASCSMLTMLLMPLDSVSLTPDCLLPLSMTELHPPSTLTPWLPLYLMVSHLPLLRTPLRLLRPVLPTSLLLRLPRLIGRSVVLMLSRHPCRLHQCSVRPHSLCAQCSRCPHLCWSAHHLLWRWISRSWISWSWILRSWIPLLRRECKTALIVCTL